MTQINRKDLKRQAREAMRLTRPRFWVVCLIYLLLTTGVESLIRQLSSYQGPVLEQFSFFVFSAPFFITSTIWLSGLATTSGPCGPGAGLIRGQVP